MNNPDLILLWHCFFYDHPYDGVGLYKDQPVWFKLVIEGGWEFLSELPEDRSTLSSHEVESIETKEDLVSIGLPYEDGHWCRDSEYAIYKLTPEQFEILNLRHEESLSYGFICSDHRPEKKNMVVNCTEEEKKEYLENIKLRNYDRDFNKSLSNGEKLGQFRWFQFTNWKHN